MFWTEYFVSLNQELFQMQRQLYIEQWGINWYHTLSTALDEVSYKPISL
jgi:hypothetical protein